MNTASRSEIEARLSYVGLEMTPQRFAILEYLLHNTGRVTAEQIILALNRRYPRPSRSIISDTLTALCEARLVKEVFSDGTETCYEADIDADDQFESGELDDD